MSSLGTFYMPKYAGKSVGDRFYGYHSMQKKLPAIL